MNPIISKGMAGIASSTVKTLTNIILKDFKYKYHIKCDKSQRDNDYEEYINCEFIDESVYNNVEFTILESFDKNRKATILALLCSTENHEDFVKYIINNANCYGFSLDRESDECKLYTRIIRDLVEEMFNPNKLSKYIDCLSENELYVQMFKGNNEIKDIILKLSFQFYQIPDLISALHKLINNLDKDLPTESISNCKIHDDNDEFLTKYNDDLFLETKEYTGDDYIATLKSVYVEPRLEHGNQLLKEKLKGWNQKPDRQSYKRTDANAKIFLLYGKAGVGKSSFTADVIAKKFIGHNCHAIALRKYIEILDDNKAWESLKLCFECKDDKMYDGAVLILDGLDEVCVLKYQFNGNEFIENLKCSSPSGVKILITSRNHEGYFKEIKPDNKLIISSIAWSEEEITNWCEKYCSVHKGNTRKQEWCKKFKKQYSLLDKDDKRKNIFCVPIILYICCAKEINISKHKSVAGIYDAAFRHIGRREHGKENSENLRHFDDKQFKINWQYTKELAYQMFLNDTLESGLDNKLVRRARISTARLLHEMDYGIDNDIQKCFAVFHFLSSKGEGVEFAHKTVGEYFTAIKLYEDYFNKISVESKEEIIAASSTWKYIYQAFRYKKIPSDIMQYLVEIIKLRKNKDYEKWRKIFINYYYIGMNYQLLWKTMNIKSHYKPNLTLMLPEHVAIAFRNLTHLLTSLEFTNNDNNVSYEYIKTFSSFFIRTIRMDVNCKNWENLNYINLNVSLVYNNENSEYLYGVDLKGANLRNSNFIGADLIIANFSNCDLTNSNFAGANLINVDFTGANLTNVDFTGANLTNADFTDCRLINIHIDETDLPKFDIAIQKYNIKLIDPCVTCFMEYERYIYDPETNRMIPPKE